MIKWFKNRITKALLRLKYYSKLNIQTGCQIGWHSHFEGANKIYEQVAFSGFLGYGSYIGPKSRLTGCHIGRFTSIGPEVAHNPGSHPYMPPYATTCPMFFSTNKQNGQSFVAEEKYAEIKYLDSNNKKYTLRIGNDCWIGERVFIAGGVTIHDGAVVLSGAIVTKDIPPYAIAGGVPASILKYRYDEQTIQTLLENKWWEKELIWLQRNAPAMCDITALLELLKSEKNDI